MQQLEQGHGIYGWRQIKRYACRMETLSEEANWRLEVLKFWDKHGLEAAQNFYKISRRTLFRWKHLISPLRPLNCWEALSMPFMRSQPTQTQQPC